MKLPYHKLSDVKFLKIRLEHNYYIVSLIKGFVLCVSIVRDIVSKIILFQKILFRLGLISQNEES